MGIPDRLVAELVELIAERTAAKVIRAIPRQDAPNAAVELRLEPILLTTEQAAALLSLSAQTLRNLRHLEQGPPAVTRGRTVRYRPEDLKAWAAVEFTPARSRE